MSYYVRMPSGLQNQVWKIEGDTAVRIGVTNPEQGAGTFFRANPGETIWDAIRRQASAWFEPDGRNPFHKTALALGEFYPRMARPIDQHPNEAPGWSPSAQIEADVIAVARGQLAALMRQLERICETVHPTQKTFNVFGHDIRNFLILACTEVENHWRGVLAANGVIKPRYNTRDYVALTDAMKLEEYSVLFPNYPWLAPFVPYQGWRETSKPSQVLAWYDAYNAVKHSRETEFERATLFCAFEAISACVVMIVAQFGLPAGLGNSPALRSFFQLSRAPAWPLSEVYIFPYGKEIGDWSPVHYPFNSIEKKRQ